MCVRKGCQRQRWDCEANSQRGSCPHSVGGSPMRGAGSKMEPFLYK